MLEEVKQLLRGMPRLMKLRYFLYFVLFFVVVVILFLFCFSILLMYIFYFLRSQSTTKFESDYPQLLTIIEYLNGSTVTSHGQNGQKILIYNLLHSLEISSSLQWEKNHKKSKKISTSEFSQTSKQHESKGRVYSHECEFFPNFTRNYAIT